MGGQPRYPAARKLMTADINATIAGAGEVDADATFTEIRGTGLSRSTAAFATAVKKR